MINKFENELNKILKNCELCKAKMCGLCPNGKRKKILKDELKKANPEKYQINPFLKFFKDIFKG
nr:hypothetical protein [uncultured Cetobacterium sp.]